jgi:hypothetical protein
MADSVHVTKTQLDALHKPGCLARHQKRDSGNPCSHQWQAVEQAEAHAGVYNYPTYQELCRESTGGSYFRPSATTGLRRRPAPGEWDVGRGDNFQHFRVPYWHNAHHIIPNGVLRSGIAKAGKGDSRLPNLIKYALLKAEYNLNDKENMVILPMQSIVAKAIALPRHLKGDEVGPGETPEIFSHPDYSTRVETKLVPILNKYKKVIAKALEKKHPELPGPISRSALEQLSMEIYSAIISHGSAADFNGSSLADVDLS